MGRIRTVAAVIKTVVGFGRNLGMCKSVTFDAEVSSCGFDTAKHYEYTSTSFSRVTFREVLRGLGRLAKNVILVNY